MNTNQLKSLDEQICEEHFKVLEDEIATLRQTLNEKDVKITYLDTLTSAYGECIQKYADLVRKITERLKYVEETRMK